MKPSKNAYGEVSWEVIGLLVNLIKFYLETKLNKKIILQSDSNKIIFAEENKRWLCGLFVISKHPNTNLRDEVLVFYLEDKTLLEKYPNIHNDLMKMIGSHAGIRSPEN